MRLRERLEAPVDVASLVAFRVMFGLLIASAIARFWLKDGIHDAFVAPTFFFPYFGWEWLRPLPGVGMYVVYAAMFVLALGFAAGALYRVCAGGLFVLFTYAHLADATNYLNHYYLVSLLLFLSTFLPLHAAGSVDARLRPAVQRSSLPSWMLWLVRFQIGLVYFFGGLAKLQGDWLLRAMPLKLWLAASGDFPVLGPLLRIPTTAYAMSWAGAIFDLSTPFLLSHRRTRPFAYAVACAFHVVTARLFQIGMFPWIMMAVSLVFFDPSWPRKIFRLPRVETGATALRSRTPWLALAAAYVLLQLVLPLRYLLYPGNVLWTEQGYRFSWRVMVIEKTGSAELRLEDPQTRAVSHARLRDELTPFQVKMMATQPDMIRAYAKHLADRGEQRGGPRPRVYADVRVVLNGRPPALLVDPDVDLAAPYVVDWIRPGP